MVQDVQLQVTFRDVKSTPTISVDVYAFFQKPIYRPTTLAIHTYEPNSMVHDMRLTMQGFSKTDSRRAGAPPKISQDKARKYMRWIRKSGGVASYIAVLCVSACDTVIERNHRVIATTEEPSESHDARVEDNTLKETARIQGVNPAIIKLIVTDSTVDNPDFSDRVQIKPRSCDPGGHPDDIGDALSIAEWYYSTPSCFQTTFPNDWIIENIKPAIRKSQPTVSFFVKPTRRRYMTGLVIPGEMVDGSEPAHNCALQFELIPKAGGDPKGPYNLYTDPSNRQFTTNTPEDFRALLGNEEVRWDMNTIRLIPRPTSDCSPVDPENTYLVTDAVVSDGQVTLKPIKLKPTRPDIIILIANFTGQEGPANQSVNTTKQYPWRNIHELRESLLTFLKIVFESYHEKAYRIHLFFADNNGLYSRQRSIISSSTLATQEAREKLAVEIAYNMQFVTEDYKDGQAKEKVEKEIEKLALKNEIYQIYLFGRSGFSDTVSYCGNVELLPKRRGKVVIIDYSSASNEAAPHSNEYPLHGDFPSIYCPEDHYHLLLLPSQKSSFYWRRGLDDVFHEFIKKAANKIDQ